MKLGICTGFEHVETKTEEVVFREEVDFLSSLAFVVHPASPSGAIFILAGCHVRASAGDLAVHGALIRVCVCVCVCPVSNSFLITPRIGTKFVSVDR